MLDSATILLRKKCLYSELICSVFSRFRTEYREILRISPYSVRMRENADYNSKYGEFLRSALLNYTLSRMRRISENVFGIWGSRFCVFTVSMALSPEKPVTITLATVALHNILRKKGRLLYTDKNVLNRENKDGSVTEGNWSNGANVLVNIPKKKTTMHKNRQIRSEIHFLIIFMDLGLFHGSGMYYWEQNRNNIRQTSNFNVIFFFKPYYCRKRLNT